MKIENFLNQINTYLDDTGKNLEQYPLIYKITLIAMHFIRAGANVALMQCSIFSFPVTCALLLGSSLIYRVAVERFCLFVRFAIPSCLGAITIKVIPVTVIPFLCYTSYVIYQSNEAVNNLPQACCRSDKQSSNA